MITSKMERWIEAYIEDKKLAWSRASLISERHRLNGMKDALEGWDAAKLWNTLQGHKPYTRVTMFSRAAAFLDWLMEEGHVPVQANPYKKFRRKNAKVFKNAYQRNYPEISYEEAQKRLSSIPDPDVRAHALALLEGGLRASEYAAVEGDFTTGKGGKRRRVYLRQSPEERAKAGANYARLYRACKQVGMKPHDCRKLFAMRLVESGADTFDLTDIMGWSNLNTASSYIKKNKARLEALAKKAQGGAQNDGKETA